MNNPHNLLLIQFIIINFNFIENCNTFYFIMKINNIKMLKFNNN